MSSVGDSTLSPLKKNITWGNVVDLSDGYGLDQITLYPSQLNAADGRINPLMLMTPAYGADGRVSSLTANTVTGTLSAKGDFPQNSEFGVRAVGVASGMTSRQLDYTKALAEGNTFASKASSAAAMSLNTYGSDLANIVVARALNKSDTISKKDITALKSMVNGLLNDEKKDGAINHLENAYIQYILAFAASSMSGEDDAIWTAVKGKVNAKASLADILTAGGASVPAELSTPITALAATRTKVESALTILNGLTDKDSYHWTDDQIGTVVNLLADAGYMTVNGIPAEELRDAAKQNELVASVASGGIHVILTSGAGVYADIADHCGTYDAHVENLSIVYGGLNLTGLSAKMTAQAGTDTKYLSKLATTLTNKMPAGDTGTLPISEFYGYIIDLAFRTNAAESNLLLQTTPTDRIYGENNTNEATMGHGSTMTFKSTTNGFSNEKVKELMRAIRVVFFIPAVNAGEFNEIQAYAKLDVDNATIGVDGVTANLYLYTSATTYHLGDGTEVFEKDGKYYTDTTYGEEAEGTVTPKVTETMVTESANAKIMALQQNVATALSVLVYLDGETIGNDDVAATNAKSMEGKLNLQFASSATLVPMEYADLHQPATPENP